MKNVASAMLQSACHRCGQASRETWLGHRVLVRAKLVGVGQPQLLRVLYVPTTL